MPPKNCVFTEKIWEASKKQLTEKNWEASKKQLTRLYSKP
jgi:hypothetical protein